MSTALQEQLDEWMDGYIIPEDQQNDEHKFTIDSAEKAEWAMRKISRQRQRIKEYQALAQSNIDKIYEWLHSVEKPDMDSISYLEGLLQPWVATQIEGKKKSIKLPAGTAGFRSQPPEYERNNDVLLQWVEKAKPEHVKKDVVWGDLKKELAVVAGQALLKDTGEIVPGIVVTERPDAFYTKTGE